MNQTTTIESKSKVHSDDCAHCGLPVPEYRKLRDVDKRFCCSGCEAVYQIISENNLSYYYHLQEESNAGGIPAAEPTTEKNLAYFDSDEFQQHHVSFCDKGNERLATIELFLEGVHCPACVWLLEGLPKFSDGVREVRVNLAKSTAEIQYIPEKIKLSQLASRLTSFGYRPHPYRGANHAALRRQVERRLLSGLGIAAACAGNVMLISICLYTGVFTEGDERYVEFFRWAAFLITIPAIVWPARIFYQRAFAAIRSRQVHLDVPISIGILSAFVASAINTLRGSGEIYFDSINVILFLLLVSRFLQFRAQHRANEKAELLFSLLPSHVHLVSDGEIVEYALENVEPGQKIEVRAGETIPVDGEIVSGSSLIDCSIITGEAVPIAMEAGNLLHAGMVNLNSPLIVEVKSTGEKTRIGRLAQLATDIQQGKAPVLHLVDRLSKWFVVFVLLLGTVAFFSGLAYSWQEAFERLIALLIISCPCALGMATPLALSVAMGNAARVGIHLRSSTAIELAAKIKTFVFDKTGTLTKGKFEVHRWWGNRDVAPLVVALERRSSHVIARSLVSSLSLDQGDDLEVVNVVEQGSKGIVGDVAGKFVVIGNESFLCAKGVELTSDNHTEMSSFANDGLTPILVAVDNKLEAIFGLGDPFQEGVGEVVSRLQGQGFELMLLSGDNRKVVENTAKLLNIPSDHSYGEQTPEDKLRKVKELECKSPVMMFGDGTNDAAALAAASVGVSVHGGAEASFLVADGFFSRSDIRLVERFIQGSRDTIRVVNSGLISSLCFNLTGCSLAILGYVSPLVAALLMPVSSLVVVVLAFSQRSFLKGAGRWK